MNKRRRAHINTVRAKLDDLADELEELCGQEQDYFDKMPEAFQFGAKGSAIDVGINHLSDAISSVRDAVTEIDLGLGFPQGHRPAGCWMPR